MAYVSDFAFNNMSRIGNDNCSQDINSIQNTQACNYLLQNYFSSDCNMSKAQQLAMTQPCINYKGSMGSDLCGSNIDSSSRLLIGTVQTHPKSKIDLFQRPFATVPFLGRGNVDVGRENELKFGDTFKEKKSVVQMGETPFLCLDSYPLYDKEIVAKKSSVESGWYSGVNTRDLYKDKEYCKDKNKK